METTENFEHQLDREWLATNGIGGYASSTPVGLNTRKVPRPARGGDDAAY